MINSEQIQALKAAAESCDKQETLSLVVYHGKMCLRNKGGIVFTVLRDICFPEYSAENENYARLAELCTPDSILSLLAERDADKALIAELQGIRAAAEKLVRCKGRYHSEQNYRALAALFGVNTPDLPPLDGEARMLTVKLPESVIDAICLTAAEIHNLGRGVSDDRAQEIINSIRCAAGITLVVEE